MTGNASIEDLRHYAAYMIDQGALVLDENSALRVAATNQLLLERGHEIDDTPVEPWLDGWSLETGPHGSRRSEIVERIRGNLDKLLPPDLVKPVAHDLPDFWVASWPQPVLSRDLTTLARAHLTRDLVARMGRGGEETPIGRHLAYDASGFRSLSFRTSLPFDEEHPKVAVLSPLLGWTQGLVETDRHLGLFVEKWMEIVKGQRRIGRPGVWWRGVLA